MYGKGKDTTLVVRSASWLLLTGCLRLVGGLSLMLTATAPNLGIDTAARVAIGVASAIVLTIAFRTFVAGVFVEDDRVLVRNPLRSRRLRWDEIEDVAPGRRTPLIWLTLAGGKHVALCGWGWPTAAARERMVSRLLAARPTQVAA